MLKVALTGGIATGKSFVLAAFGRRGVPCLDADELAHGVTAPGTEATAAIAARFGSAILTPEGGVDRAALGTIVFADAAARRDLEAIVHPAVYRAISVGMRAFERLGTDPVAVADIPLLFESGHSGDFDRVIVTLCSPDLQMNRLLARGLDEPSARQRLAAQWPTPEKAARADFVIDTNGTMQETEKQVEDILAQLRRE